MEFHVHSPIVSSNGGLTHADGLATPTWGPPLRQEPFDDSYRTLPRTVELRLGEGQRQFNSPSEIFWDSQPFSDRNDTRRPVGRQWLAQGPSLTQRLAMLPPQGRETAALIGTHYPPMSTVRPPQGRETAALIEAHRPPLSAMQPLGWRETLEPDGTHPSTAQSFFELLSNATWNVLNPWVLRIDKTLLCRKPPHRTGSLRCFITVSHFVLDNCADQAFTTFATDSAARLKQVILKNLGITVNVVKTDKTYEVTISDFFRFEENLKRFLAHTECFKLQPIICRSIPVKRQILKIASSSFLGLIETPCIATKLLPNNDFAYYHNHFAHQENSAYQEALACECVDMLNDNLGFNSKPKSFQQAALYLKTSHVIQILNSVDFKTRLQEYAKFDKNWTKKVWTIPRLNVKFVSKVEFEAFLSTGNCI